MLARMIRSAPFRPVHLVVLAAIAAALSVTLAPFLHPPVAVHAPIVEGRGVA